MNNFNSDFILEKYNRNLSEKNLSSATVNAYTTDAKLYLDYFRSIKAHISDINTFADLESYRKNLSGSLSDNSMRRKVISLKHFIDFVINDTENRNFKTPSAIPSRLDSQAYEFDDEFLMKCNEGVKNQNCLLKTYRDLSIINLIAIEGLKVSELIKTRKKDLAWSDKGSLYLNIRHSRSRSFFVNKITQDAIENYLLELDKLNLDTDRLLIGMKGTKLGKILPEMTRHGVKFFINELSRKISLELSAEKLRQHAIWFHIEAGKNSQELMQHFGLKQPGIINKYINARRNSHDER